MGSAVMMAMAKAMVRRVQPPGGGLYAAALANYLSHVFNRYTGCVCDIAWLPRVSACADAFRLAEAAPALARLEWDVIEWLCREFACVAYRRDGSECDACCATRTRHTVCRQLLRASLHQAAPWPILAL